MTEKEARVKIRAPIVTELNEQRKKKKNQKGRREGISMDGSVGNIINGYLG